MKAGGKLVIENKNALVFHGPWLGQLQLNCVTHIGRRGGANALNADGVAVPLSGSGVAVESICGRDNHAEAAKRLVAGVQEMVGAMNGEMRLGRSDEMKLNILFLDDVTWPERDAATG